jgi:hypothetical protein
MGLCESHSYPWFHLDSDVVVTLKTVHARPGYAVIYAKFPSDNLIPTRLLKSHPNYAQLFLFAVRNQGKELVFTTSLENVLIDSYWCVHNITAKSESKEASFVDTVTEIVSYNHNGEDVTEVIFKQKKNYCYYLSEDLEEPIKGCEYEITYTPLDEPGARIITMSQMMASDKYTAL